jgi:hypothetical protein
VEIHKPKPWHGWREFLKEYAIVVVGVLTALAAEQSVEALHHHSEVRELRRALDQELAWNLAMMESMAVVHDCTMQRLDELQAWSKAAEAGRPLRLEPMSGEPGFSIFRSAAWRSASSSTLDHMPAEARIAYANFYAGVENNQAYRQTFLDGWRDLSPFEDERSLTHEDRLRIAHDVDEIRHAASSLAKNYRTWRDFYAPPLRIRVEDARLLPDELAMRNATRAVLCKPLTVRPG